MDNFQAIKDNITMRQVTDHYGYAINCAGFIKCPFHNGDDTGSLKIYDGNRGFHCFGCQQGGSVIDFVSLHDNITPLEAIKLLNDVFNVGLSFDAPISEFMRLTHTIRRLTKELVAAQDKASYWRLYSELDKRGLKNKAKAKNMVADIERRLSYCNEQLFSGKFDGDMKEYFDTVVAERVDRFMKGASSNEH